jgi:hypothetical protein
MISTLSKTNELKSRAMNTYISLMTSKDNILQTVGLHETLFFDKEHQVHLPIY